jgi:hypothetical protein
VLLKIVRVKHGEGGVGNEPLVWVMCVRGVVRGVA